MKISIPIQRFNGIDQDVDPRPEVELRQTEDGLIVLKFPGNNAYQLSESQLRKAVLLLENSTDDVVTISRAEYEMTRKHSKTLIALEAAGVDNWEGYNEAITQ